jgi:hypothetical protein
MDTKHNVRVGDQTRMIEEKTKSAARQSDFPLTSLSVHVSVLIGIYDLSDSVHADRPLMTAHYFLVRTAAYWLMAAALRSLHNCTCRPSNLWNASPCVSVYYSATPEIPHILWKLKVHYRVHEIPPPVPLLSQINPLPNPPILFL